MLKALPGPPLSERLSQFLLCHPVLRLVPATLAIMARRREAQPYLERSRIFNALKQHDLAIKDLSAALRLDPEKRHYYLYLRHLHHMAMGRPAIALEDILETLRAAPEGFSDYFRCAASVYEALGQPDKALDILNEGVRRHPGNADALSRRADYHSQKGRFAEAIADVSLAIEMATDAWRRYILLHERAKLFAKQGNFDAALADCNRCIFEQPSQWTHYAMRSKVYRAMGAVQAAESDEFRSMKLNPSISLR